MPRRKGAPTAKNRPPARRRTKGRQLVWVDQRPLRRKAATECSRAMARLEKARGEWRRYEREDQPAFRRWEAATFGPLMSRVRELEARVQERESLVRDVEEEVFFGSSHNYRAAYSRVQRRRASPSAQNGAQRPGHGQKFQEEVDEELNDFEQELLFEEFVRTFLGMNPDRMSDRQYAKMFADFKAKVLGQPAPEPPDAEPEPQAMLPGSAEPKSGENRVKDLYRLLVRRLHPDMRADSNAEVSALWHEVQEAYAAGNLDRLEMLLAFTDIQAKTAGEHTTLFQMQSVLAELKTAYHALQRNLRTAKKDDAWNFARLAERGDLEVRVRQRLEATLLERERQLRELDTLITHWAGPANGHERKAPRTMQQADFSF